GSLSIVFEAHDSARQRRVALKVLAPSRATNPLARGHFLHAARSAAGVRHPAVVAIQAVDEFAGLPYLVMPLVYGGSLQDRMNRHPRLPLPDAVRIAAEVAEGLAAAHDKGVVHGDLDPANVLLDGPTGQALVTDFGLAGAADSN